MKKTGNRGSYNPFTILFAAVWMLMTAAKRQLVIDRPSVSLPIDETLVKDYDGTSMSAHQFLFFKIEPTDG